jgi:hypothetical protein
VFTPTTSPRDVTRGPPQGAHYARRHRTLEAVWIADRDRQLADPERLGIAQRGRHQVPRTDPDDGQIRPRVVTDYLGLQPSAIRQGHCDFGGAVDDVAVGEDEPIRGKEKARPVAADPRKLAPALAHLDVDHRGADPFRRADHGL